MRVFKYIFIKDSNESVRVQIYPMQEYNDPFDQKTVGDKDRIKPVEQIIMEADNISPPIISNGAEVPLSALPVHEKIVKPEGNTPIYKEVRIDDTEETKETASSKEKRTINE